MTRADAPMATTTNAFSDTELAYLQGERRFGVMREYWRAPDGTWLDRLLMELLARELEPE